MDASAALVSAFVHGLAAGVSLAVGIAVARSSLNRNIRIATALATVSIGGWVVNESPPLWQAMGEPVVLLILACPVAGLFWLFLLTIFADWRVTPLTLAPAVLQLVSGLAMPFVQGEAGPILWGARNLFSAALAIHAGVLILRGWNDDLVERRRRFRALLLVMACLFVLVEVGAGFGYRLDPAGPWLGLSVGRPMGGLMLAALTLALSILILGVQPSAFGAPRRADPVVDARSEAADRQLIERLDALMAAEAWRREGLTIGDLARELETPEHRLRRLINQRLGYRNFADFLNGRRIEAAKRRLADPQEARTTIAAVAFDLGFGSLGPFNRAFRAATGLTPSAWRQRALAETSPKLKEAV